MPRQQYVMVMAMVPDNYPDQGLPGPQPPGGGGGGGLHPGWPTVPGWGGSLPGGQPPRPDNSLPPFPSFPIYIPITPPPDSGLEPTHPIYIPVYPDNALPGSQPRPDNTLPGNQPYPDNSLPGSQPRPDNTLPGGQPYPDNTLPGQGGQDPRPALIAKIKKVVDFWTGNMPTNPNPTPEPTA